MFIGGGDYYDSCVQSLEFSVSRLTMEVVMGRLDRKFTIMAGPAMEGHEFRAGKQTLRGRACPWNTFSIWKVSAIGLIGFPLISDGVGGDRSIGGVEVNNSFFCQPVLAIMIRAFYLNAIVRCCLLMALAASCAGVDRNNLAAADRSAVPCGVSAHRTASRHCGG